MLQVVSQVVTVSVKAVQSEAETLISRLIDRPIRPLFPEGYYNEIQVTATVISSDKTMEARYCCNVGYFSCDCLLLVFHLRGPIGRRTCWFNQR